MREFPVESSTIPTPFLGVYRDTLVRNTHKVLELARNPERLRPHIKTYKSSRMAGFLLSHGITRFKCATIGEAKLLARAGARDVLVAYPLIEPAIRSIAALKSRYRATNFSIIADNLKQVEQIEKVFTALGAGMNVFLDVDVGQQRTGVKPDKRALSLYRRIDESPSLRVAGLHAYDGHNHQQDKTERDSAAEECYQAATDLRRRLISEGFEVPTLIMGGTPTFPYYAAKDDVDLSPGTSFFYDSGYGTNHPDLPFEAAAYVFGRIISIPTDSTITVDVGAKAIATDPPGERGSFPDHELEPVKQNEEHWVLRCTDSRVYSIGDRIRIIPKHICPTVNLYNRIFLLDDREMITDSWIVDGHDRILEDI